MEDHRGRAVVVAIAKITYDITKSGVVHLARPAAQIRLAAEPHHVDSFASIKYPSDAVDEKPGTDVIVLGTVIPPPSHSVTQMDVSVRVGCLSSVLRVYGTRVYQRAAFGGLVPGPAERLEPTPLVYELAFGGVETEPFGMYPKNPSGIGFADMRNKRPGGPAPRIEVPDEMADEIALPAGFGAIDAFWSPRLEFAGTRDESWRKTRAPILPRDFDLLHNCVAHPNLHSPEPLRPDEPVEILGMTLDGIWRFRLPKVFPTFSSLHEGVVRDHATHLDTILIDVDERRVEMVWRVCLPLPRKAQQLERITIRVTGEIPSPRVVTTEAA
jgi:hypothetical protein